MRIKLVTFILILLLLFSYGCSSGDAENGSAETSVNVVTTIYPLADIINELGGELVNVSYLLPPGASPHTYEPTVEQARQVEEAKLFVHVGAGLDNWAAQLAEASGADLVIVDLSTKVRLVEQPGYISLEGAGDNGHDHDHGDCSHEGCCGDGPDDPHFWLDPLVVRDSICPAVMEALVAIDPENEERFEQKLTQYQQEITLLHKEIEAAAASFSQQGFIAFHSAWQYFAQRYNLEEVAVIAEFPGQEPSAGWLAELVELIKTEQIGAIFTEPQFSSALAERIAEESGAEVKVIDPLGGEDVPSRETYLELMRFNLAAFKEALQ